LQLKTVGWLMVVMLGCSTINEVPFEARIPLQVRNNLLLLQLTVNGKAADFIIDTGASISLIDQSKTEKYGFKIY